MRYPALESLRGLAALVVVIHHHLMALPAFSYDDIASQPQTALTTLMLYTPLHLFWAGGEAVILFFVLSGFVLSLSVWDGKALDMQQFILKRLWRIWVPFMVAVTVAAVLAMLLGSQSVDGASSWFNRIWAGANVRAYLHHALMLWQMDADNHAFIPVVWSLKWEMWGSLLLPLVLLWARQTPIIVLTTCALSIALFWSGGAGTDIGSGLARYLPMFVIGAALALHRERLARWVARSSPALLLALALLLIPSSWYVFGDRGVPWSLRPVFDWVVVGGASLLIALAIGWLRLQRWLERPALLWLGRVSFSLYLYHSLVLTVVVRLGHELLPLPLLVLTSFLLTFPAAHLAYHWVEHPAIRRGRTLPPPTLA